MKTQIQQKIGALLLMVIFVSVNVSAKDYYCNPNSGSIKNEGSSKKPWGKLEDVFKKGKTFEAGDNIYLLKGNHGDVVVSGINAKYVKIIGKDGATLSAITFGDKSKSAQKWSLQNVDIKNDNKAIFVSANSSKIKIYSVNIYGSVAFINATANQLKNVKSVGIEIAGSKIKVENSNIHDKAVSVLVSGHHNQVRNNVITNFTKVAIQSSNDFNTFENNLISESFQVAENNNTAFLIKSDKLISSNVIRANQIINFKRYNRDFIGQLNGIVAVSALTNSIIENNVVVTNSVSGIKAINVSSSKFVNNTLANPYFGIVLDEKKNISNSIIIGDEKGVKSENVVVRNNIASAFVLENATGVADFNLEVKGEIKDYDKNFFNWAKFDFSLAESSPALNAGTFEGAPKTDASLVSRKLGNFINIGAFEYGKIDESNNEIIIMGDGHDRELRSKGKSDWDGQPKIKVGGSGADFDGVAVFPFKLPLLPGGKQIVEADFSAYMDKIDNKPNGNIDVYGLAFSDKYWVTDNMFYQGQYGQDLTARPIQSSIADGTSISGTTKLSSVGKIGLKGYLNTAYDAGAKVGDFVFIRLNPSVKDVTKYHRWIFQSANVEKDKKKPKLYLTVGYPELNKDGVAFNSIDNTIIASANPLVKGKINLRLYGFEESRLHIKLYTYKGDVVLDKEIHASDNMFYESVNDNVLATGKYILEFKKGESVKKQTVFVW
ncbi:MAG: right-handed parallel beta-helix repeat-containing protein [Ichthyobacteriaceae bacterium]|nr:right-handed parallel beta-helix repeat-containing protein [Ichthyobacteriaceae bacterium]